jgi:hypothetical protein
MDSRFRMRRGLVGGVGDKVGLVTRPSSLVTPASRRCTPALPANSLLVTPASRRPASPQLPY